MSIRHFVILDGEHKITSGEQVAKWAGMLENYSFHEHTGITTISVEIDSTEDFSDFFNETWTKA